MIEDEMAGQYHQLNGYEFEQTLGDSEGQGSLACCSPQGHKESDMTQSLNNNNTLYYKDLTLQSLLKIDSKQVISWNNKN